MMGSIIELLEKNSTDPRVRLELGQQILAQLQISRLPSDSTVLNEFCDVAVQWLSASNFKVALLAVEILDVAVEVSGGVIAPYLIDRSSALIERLGDTKVNVRNAAAMLITTLATSQHCSPQIILEKIAPGLEHRQWLVRIGVMQVIRNILENRKFEVEIQINRLIPTLCKLMGDPNSDVREAAANTLVNIFYHLGDQVPASIHKRQLIPESKFQMLLARFNEAQQGGGLAPSIPSTSAQRAPRPIRRPLLPQKPTSISQIGRNPIGRSTAPSLDDQENTGSVDGRLSSSSVWSRASSVPAHRRPIAVTAKTPGNAGAVSDDAFKKAFLQVPKCDIYSEKDLNDRLRTAVEILQDPNKDWDKRVAELKMLRAFIIGGALDVSDFTEELRSLERPLLVSVKDLRSQVCREACVTVAYFCERLESKMTNVVETLMPTLINLLQNSAKVMATSAQVALQYVFKYIHSSKLLPFLQTALSSKSRVIRTYAAQLLLIVLSLWDARLIEKNMQLITDCINMSLNDADPETRKVGRLLFNQLDQDFKEQASLLFQSLDPSKQKALHGHVSQSSSSQSIISEKDSFPSYKSAGGHSLQKASCYYSGRSTSDIDHGAARRAIASRTNWSRPPGGPLQPINSSQASRYQTYKTPTQSRQPISARRQIYTPSQGSVSQRRQPASLSQPGSRSSSPGARSSSRNTPQPTTLNRHTNGNSNYLMEHTVSDALRKQGFDGGDVEDLGSVVSEFKFETAALPTALSCCAQTSVSERREGLKALFSILQNERLGPHDLKKVVERMNLLIGEGAHKLLPLIVDVMGVLVRKYHSDLEDWLNHLIPKLISKYSGEALPTSRDQYLTMINAVQSEFDAEKQLQAVCRFIRDPIRNGVPVKVRYGLLDYLHKLMQNMHSAPSLNQSEVRQALSKIFLWVDDPKSGDMLNDLSEKVVSDMFNLNASDFTSMIATYPNDLRSRLQAIVRRNNLSPRANVLSSSDAHVGILETTAQINEFVDTRNSLVTSHLPSSLLGDLGIHNGLDLISENGVYRNNRAEAGNSFSAYLHDPATLAKDTGLQEELITKIGEQLSLHNQRTPERLRAITVLSQVTRENLFTLWDEHFRMIFLILVETLKDENADMRRMALKVIKEICHTQATRFNTFAEMALMRVLEASADEVKQVASMAEDCGNVLATHVSSQACRKVLIAVIKSDTNIPKIQLAIKMLTKVIESLSAEELLPLLDEVVPPIVNTYNYESSSVRKASVLCLVAINDIVGSAAMEPYYQDLNKGKLKLLEVYIQRKKANNNASLHSSVQF